MNERMTEIREALAGLGAEKGCYYPAKELCERFEQLQSALARGVFEKTHAENMRDKDVRNHFKALSESYGLLDSPCFTRLDANLLSLSYAIGSYKRGASGERDCQRALRTFSHDQGIKILCNVALEGEDGKTEYDAIVIAPYGIFIIEMKKWSGPVVITEHGIMKQTTGNRTIYDLAERMNVKKDLLRSLLGGKMPDVCVPFVVFSDANTEVDDQYHKVPYYIGGGYPNRIRDYKKFGLCLSPEDIESIYETLKTNHKEQQMRCNVDCTAIIEDYSSLMAQIETLAREADSQHIDTPEMSAETNTHPITSEQTTATVIEPKSFFSRIFNQKTAANIGKAVGAICIALPAVVSLTTGRYR